MSLEWNSSFNCGPIANDSSARFGASSSASSLDAPSDLSCSYALLYRASNFVNNTITGTDYRESAHQLNVQDGQIQGLTASCVALREKFDLGFGDRPVCLVHWDAVPI
jgi:hypothetical protein